MKRTSAFLFAMVGLSVASAAPMENYYPTGTGTLTMNRNYRPVIIKYNGGSRVYGSEIGFNATLDTSVIPNQLTKLGNSSQNGGANISVDNWGNVYFQMFNAGVVDEVTTDRNPQINFRGP